MTGHICTSFTLFESNSGGVRDLPIRRPPVRADRCVRRGRVRWRWCSGVLFLRSSLRSASSPRLRRGRHPPPTSTVILDQAKLIKLPEKVATIVIGNPLIADASLQPGGLMVITGKGYGMTNIIALDRTGAVLMEKTIEVQGPREHVVVALSRRRARDLQLHAELRAADHAGRRHHLFRYACSVRPPPAPARPRAPRRRSDGRASARGPGARCR